MRRTTILLEVAQFERLKARARRRSHTLSDEVRAVIDQALDREPDDTNHPLLELVRKMEALGPPRPGLWIDIDSEEGKLQAARDIYRDAMNREPDL